ncbi:MAG TPA: phage major capsid protein [Candidatus Borkfalkia avistercoris]|uniref:Phage major capsid protein n=1 Tax=Candidatus Borkfalkia avistercoris TaxID=2838504 RepID=A0A9D2A7G8_9FIRM|nr:phage major capsid protein [Candidatus Borkfalkia avistercoris]
MVTMTSADNALKSVYLGVVSDQLNTAANPLLAAIRQSTADVWGKEVRRLARYGVNGGVGAGTEEGDLPASAGNNYEQFVTTLKNLYGTIEISDKAVRASENNVGAFVNLLNAEMDGLVRSSSFNFGRMLFGDGSGVLTTVSAVSGTTVTAASVKNLIEGMVVDFISADTAVTGATGRRITSVDRDNKTFTVSGATLTGVAKDDKVCVQGSYNLELTGLGAIFKTTGTIYGLDRATHKWMIPYIKTSVGAITETAIQTAIDRLEETAGSRVNFIVCSWGVKRALQKLFGENKRNIDVTELAGGYRTITYNGIPVVADRFCPDGTMYLLNTEDFCLHQLCDWKWLEGDDGRVLKQVAGKPVYTATLVKYADLICTRPCGQAMLSGITEA